MLSLNEVGLGALIEIVKIKIKGPYFIDYMPPWTVKTKISK